jgi:hypothetical protein
MDFKKQKLMYKEQQKFQTEVAGLRKLSVGVLGRAY